MIKSIATEVCVESKGTEESNTDALNVEALQLAALLVKNLPNEMQEVRKDFIKFAWAELKSEDTITRQHAHILVSRFIEAFDTPPKIALTVYVALLKVNFSYTIYYIFWCILDFY